MAGGLGREEFFDPDAIIPVIEEARALELALKEVLNTSKEILKTQPFKSGKDIKVYTKEAEKATRATQNLDQIEQQRLKLQAKLTQATDKRAKELEQLKQETREQNKATKDAIVLEDREAGTLTRLAAENRKLRRERAKLNLETEEGSKRLREINAQLDKNNETIKESSDAFKQQRLNVGNYKNDIKDA